MSLLYDWQKDFVSFSGSTSWLDVTSVLTQSMMSTSTLNSLEFKVLDPG